jgi:pyridoxamine 5'-phosphate oxidase family protein
LAGFSLPEIEYLKTQRIARIATVSRRGQPDAVPVVLEFDGKYFWVGSHNDQARKYRNVKSGNNLVAITVDDVESFEPWKARALRVYGTADILDHNGKLGQGSYLRITPNVSWSFGLGAENQEHSKDWGIVKTVHRPS